MKGLTTEEKAIRYDKALDNAKVIHKTIRKELKPIIEKLFPELKESEDERIRKKLIEVVKGDMVVGGTKDKQLAIAWLEKQGEKKPWSEEDNFMYNRIKNLLTDISLAPESINSLSDWLKDLKDRVQPQTTWKPSREQIMALRWVLNHIPYDSHKEEISGLLEQLKKLREE